VHALRGVDMRVGRGEIFGLLGPNGAGKSTLVKILMTVIRPTRCEGTMLGAPVGHKPTLARVGYLPEHHRFPDYLTGAQVLDFYAALCSVPRADRRKRIPMLLELVDMTDWARQKVKSYSKGMRQRIGLAQALMNDPEIVLLDEPTDGVDPVGRRDIRRILQRLRSEGTTVFINSHILSELEMVCDRVAILVQGSVASQGTVQSLTKDQERYELELAGADAHTIAQAIPGRIETVPGAALAQTNPEAADAAMTHRGNLQGGEGVELLGARLVIRTTDAERIQPVVDALRASGVVIKSIRPMRPSLEDLFMQAVIDPVTGQPLHIGADKKSRKPKPSLN
jgi:ABC-2 type transport system ATP-binding protein